MTEYTVSIGNRQRIDLGLLERDFREGYIHDFGICKPEEIFHAANILGATTTNGQNILFNQFGLNYSFYDRTNYSAVLQAIKSALVLAKKIERGQLSFNPNLLTLILGWFNGEQAFEEQFGHIAGELQKTLYNGGSVTYTQSSNDFGLYLGAEQKFDGKQGILKVRKIELEGTAQPANSLDELLARI